MKEPPDPVLELRTARFGERPGSGLTLHQGLKLKQGLAAFNIKGGWSMLAGIFTANWGNTMISIADLLDKAKAKHGLASDYKLALVMGIRQSSLGNYRHGKTLPDDRVIALLCELTGDDPAVLAAQIQAQRAQNDPARELWTRIAARLQVGAAHVAGVLVSCLVAMVLVASYAVPARANDQITALPHTTGSALAVYYVNKAVSLIWGMLCRVHRLIRPIVPGMAVA